jgi:hypothetical protein
MNTRFRTRAVVLATAFAISAATPAAAGAVNPVSGGAPTALASCKSATVVGKHKCLQAGEYCQHTGRANRDYHRYGYSCGKRDRRGSYHLVYY